MALGDVRTKDANSLRFTLYRSRTDHLQPICALSQPSGMLNRWCRRDASVLLYRHDNLSSAANSVAVCTRDPVGRQRCFGGRQCVAVARWSFLWPADCFRLCDSCGLTPAASHAWRSPAIIDSGGEIHIEGKSHTSPSHAHRCTATRTVARNHTERSQCVRPTGR
jgi:hypothetical protein